MKNYEYGDKKKNKHHGARWAMWKMMSQMEGSLDFIHIQWDVTRELFKRLALWSLLTWTLSKQRVNILELLHIYSKNQCESADSVIFTGTRINIYQW